MLLAHLPPGISIYLLVPNPKPDVFQVIWQKCIRAEYQNVVYFALKLTVAHHVFLSRGKAMFYTLQIPLHSQIIRPTETSLRWRISIVSFISHLITCTCHPNTSCFLGPSNIKSPLKSICITSYGLMRYSAHQQTKLWDKADIILMHCNKGIPPF